MPASSHTLDRIKVSFGDHRLVADAGLMLTGTLVGRLGLEPLMEWANQVHITACRALLGHHVNRFAA